MKNNLINQEQFDALQIGDELTNEAGVLIVQIKTPLIVICYYGGSSFSQVRAYSLHTLISSGYCLKTQPKTYQGFEHGSYHDRVVMVNVSNGSLFRNQYRRLHSVDHGGFNVFFDGTNDDIVTYKNARLIYDEKNTRNDSLAK
jgi:hypothetical protein